MHKNAELTSILVILTKKVVYQLSLISSFGLLSITILLLKSAQWLNFQTALDRGPTID